MGTAEAKTNPLVVNLEPLGLFCGGHGTPIERTWVDLTQHHQVLYGLNGAGKSTVLDALRNALTGIRWRSELLVTIPFDQVDLGRVSDPISMMLTGSDIFFADQARDIFVELQDEVLHHDFNRRASLPGWGDVENSRWEEIDWAPMLIALARSSMWLFRPDGVDAPTWTAQPVLLASPGSRWSEHLKELQLILHHDEGPLAHELGLDVLWENDAPQGAPHGIVGSLLTRITQASPEWPWWPFGQVVSDAPGDLGGETRKHLALHPRDGRGSTVAPTDHDSLADRSASIEIEANVALTSLLAEAPVLSLNLGSEREWFLGESCRWTARRFESDRSISLDFLSSAEQRWSAVAARLALARGLQRDYDQFFREMAGGPLEWTSTVEDAATTWLILDEPERGLHRSAETHMARALHDSTSSQRLRTFFATHSPDLLDSGRADVLYVRRRSDSRPGGLVAMREFEGTRNELGLNPSDMLRRTRALALVEGEHDLRVLRGMIGPELTQLGVEILPLRGGARLSSALESRFLFEFTDAVIMPILDDLQMGPLSEIWSSHLTQARVRPASEVTESLRKDLQTVVGKGAAFLEEFLSAAITEGLFERVHPLGIPQSDILECLPAKALVPEASGWPELREGARRSNGGTAPSETRFKQFLEKVHRCDLSPENLESIARTSPVHPDVKALLAAVTERLR